jgi:asparagine synthase (glutamine-hydrolysing)
MCGLIGFLGGDFSNSQLNKDLLEKMSDQIINRGPDSAGIWIDAPSKVGLAHRRLAIVDLSPAGHQPMTSSSNRYVIAYNGEIYNSSEIRSELIKSGVVQNWQGHSDTETLLAGFDAWGIKDTISCVIGMFAIAIWDKDLEQLTLVRDRVGEKPLYYGWQGSGINRTFLFGSELKALKRHPQFTDEIDRGALALYMRYCYVPAPHSIYKEIKKLEPGTILTISLKNNHHTQEKYWDALDVARRGFESPFEGTEVEITNNLEAALKKTISQQMMADVPLGAFLSGGIDSSAVVALMQTQSSRPIKTFTIGFKEAGYNEAEFAKLVAGHLGTEHTELYVSSQDALDVIPKLPNLYCEPFADSSQIPTFLVSALARQHVTVSLSGDGGDELFCGYNRYLFADKIWKGLKITPTAIRELVGKSVKSLPAAGWSKTFEFLNGITPAKFNGISWGDKLQKGAGVVGSKDLTSLYHGLVSNWQDPSTVVIGEREHEKTFSTDVQMLSDVGDIEKMMAIDMVSYLPDDILVKVDRAAMGVSLETRVPFLDHHIVEFASQIPLSMKLNNGVGKAVLRDVLYRYVPRELIERPKMGFGVPVGVWLKGPLRDWAEILLDESLLEQQGFFHVGVVRDMWAEHIAGTRNWQSQLWAVLMFQAWFLENA